MDNYDFSWLPKGATIEVKKTPDSHDQREGTIYGYVTARISGVSSAFNVTVVNSNNYPISNEFDITDEAMIRAFETLKTKYNAQVQVSKYLRTFP